MTPPAQGGRTAEEREAARREREAKRAEREGRPPPEEPATAARDGNAAVDGNGPAPRAHTNSKPKPKAAKAKPKAKPPARKPAAAAEPAAQAPPEPLPPPAPATPVAATRTSPQRQVQASAHPQQREPDDWLAEAQRLTQQQAPPPGQRTSHGRRRLRVALAIFGIAVIAVLLFAAWFANSLFQPFKSDGKGEGQQVRIVVPKGASVGEIGDQLAKEGVVSSSFFFQTRARLAGRTGELKPGSYRLRHDMSFSAALDALEKGTPPSIVVITIPEGRSRTEVASLVNGKLDGNYLNATRRSKALDPREYGAKGAKDLEGFLFPATFELKRGKPMSALVNQQLSVFRQRFDNVDMRYARRKNLTPYDVLIIASLIEREAQLPKERALIASVIYNRLHEGMRLGIDASVRFITHNWSRPLRQSELANPSPYNTRIHEGLPPGPIGSPGIASIQAAAHPAKTGYLFYVVKPGGNGAHAFSKTDAEFQRDVDRYNAEREKRGGQSPATP